MGSKVIRLYAVLMVLCTACASGDSVETQLRDPSDVESPSDVIVSPSAEEVTMPTEGSDEMIGGSEDEPGGLSFEEHRAGTPPGPENLVAVPSDGGIQLTWEAAVSIGGEEHVYGESPLYYKIFRRTADELEYTQISTTTEPFFLDEDVEKGQVYYYTVVQVHAIEDGGEIDGDRPDEVEATAP